ncbi:MAG: DUF177 domain-containing protein [Muribaculaceae bacterium]|nr:DUF177 domain-containing protein [Muribaculaceae bacterium]MDE6628576.1 DUF177 domain-containing protein [Muribaculaceae bacterium]
MGKFSQFNLPLKSLAKGTHQFEYRLDKQFFDNMESADVRDADVSVALTVTYANDVYDLQFAVKGTVVVPCDRCLDDLTLDVDTTYGVKVKYGEEFRDDSDDIMEIPESENSLNVAYMIFDTVSLAIPIKHVHPMGKCNRAMSSLLKKHKATAANDPDADLEEDLIDEMDSMPDVADDSASDAPTDPRWDKLKDLQ